MALELRPICEHCAAGLSRDQWSIGDWAGMRAAASSELPAHLVGREWPVDPPQNLREYDPEWGRAASTGTLMAGCDHASMLSAVKVPVLLTHHFFRVVESTGHVQGALSDLQAKRSASSSLVPDSSSSTARCPRWATSCTPRTRRCSLAR